jgi:hypothetical protein
MEMVGRGGGGGGLGVKLVNVVGARPFDSDSYYVLTLSATARL